MKNKKKLVCMDFDGVIHSYESGWQGAKNISDPPVEGAIGYIFLLLNEGFDVVVHSSRGRYAGGIKEMKTYLKKHAEPMLWDDSEKYLGLNNVRFARYKPPAHFTIDDRAYHFTGTWPTIESIRRFKPWNK